MENIGKLGIDLWGILLYIVNFGIIFYIIGKGLIPPIRRFMKERQEQIEKSLKEAAIFQKELEETIRTNKKEREALIAESKKDRLLLEKDLQEKRETMFQEIERVRTNLLEKTLNEVEIEKQNIIMNAEKQIVAMMERVLYNILSQAIPEDVIQKSVHSAWNDQKKHLTK